MSYIEDNGFFVFDGVKSSDYGVWISGGGTYNAPARRYKDYVVPGRNGTLTLDEGAFEEIEVTYPAFIARGFSSNIEAFRNELMARSGYVRMTDSFHPDEYYLAKYMDGLEVDTAPGGRGGAFNLTFRRDPRRFLLSGEETVTLTANGNVANPTLYGSKPLIRVNFSDMAELVTQPYYTQDNPRVVNGVAFTLDETTGTVTANGTATARSYYTFKWRGGALPVGTYHLSGCPSGGSATTYNMLLWLVNSTDNTTIATFADYGDGTDVVITEPYSAYQWVLQAYVESGTSVSNIVYTPSLIPEASVQDCVLGVGDEQITLKNIYQYIDINSELQDCYCGTNNANALVTLDGFPAFEPGDTGISLGTGIESVEVTPNWWII